MSAKEDVHSNVPNAHLCVLEPTAHCYERFQVQAFARSGKPIRLTIYDRWYGSERAAWLAARAWVFRVRNYEKRKFSEAQFDKSENMAEYVTLLVAEKPAPPRKRGKKNAA